MKAEIFQKASEIIMKIRTISTNIQFMEKEEAAICYVTDIFLEEMQARHKKEATEALKLRKAELEKELADL